MHTPLTQHDTWHEQSAVNSRSMRAPFHALPAASLARLRVLHERPHILLAPDLLSADECRRLRAKALSTTLKQQSFDTAQGSGQRTSMGCVLRNDEVPTLRQRFADLAGVAVSQLQPLKVSRYERGHRFDIHTDAIRGDLRGEPPTHDDWWADRQRGMHGVVGAPLAGCNRIVTIFVYLSTVVQGGRTRWRWTQYDEARGGDAGTRFYDEPSVGHGRTDPQHGSGAEVSVAPVEGLGVIHFPSLTADQGGLTDYNAYHEAEPPVEPPEKWVLQSFIWSHPRLDFTRVLEPENWQPKRRRNDDII